MKLILVRHAEAVELGRDGVKSDFDRPLTDLGRRQAVALAAAFKARGVQPAAVVTSPLVRAIQTAEPLVAELTPDQPAVVCGRLAIGSYKPKKLSRDLAEIGNGTLVLVGHQPDMGEYAAWLLDAEPGSVKFEKSAAACIAIDGDIAAGSGTLEWLVPPAWFLPAG